MYTRNTLLFLFIFLFEFTLFGRPFGMEDKHAEFEKTGIAASVFKNALQRYQHYCSQTNARPNYLIVVDFTLPSVEKRMIVLNMQDTSIVHFDYVTHGKNSGDNFASRFSNAPESLQTSLGLYKVAETYIGMHGLSIRLDGLDKGINDKARERNIVMHAATYASPDQITTYGGRLGRSFGCPAMPESGFLKIAPIISNNALLYHHYSSED